MADELMPPPPPLQLPLDEDEDEDVLPPPVDDEDKEEGPPPPRHSPRPPSCPPPSKQAGEQKPQETPTETTTEKTTTTSPKTTAMTGEAGASPLTPSTPRPVPPVRIPTVAELRQTSLKSTPRSTTGRTTPRSVGGTPLSAKRAQVQTPRKTGISIEDARRFGQMCEELDITLTVGRSTTVLAHFARLIRKPIEAGNKTAQALCTWIGATIHSDAEFLQCVLGVSAPGYLFRYDFESAVRPLIDSLDFKAMVYLDKIMATAPFIDIVFTAFNAPQENALLVAEDLEAQDLALRAVWALMLNRKGLVSTATVWLTDCLRRNTNIPGALALKTLLPIIVSNPKQVITMSEEEREARGLEMLPSHKVTAPGLFTAALHLLRRADIHTRLAMFKEMTSLFMTSVQNCHAFISHTNWLRSLLSLLLDVRVADVAAGKDAAPNTKAHAARQVFINFASIISAILVRYVFDPDVKNGVTAPRLLLDTLNELSHFGGNRVESRFVANQILLSLLFRLRAERRFPGATAFSTEQGPWASLLQVVSIVKLFVLRSAQWGATDTIGADFRTPALSRRELMREQQREELRLVASRLSAGAPKTGNSTRSLAGRSSTSFGTLRRHTSMSMSRATSSSLSRYSSDDKAPLKLDNEPGENVALLRHVTAFSKQDDFGLHFPRPGRSVYEDDEDHGSAGHCPSDLLVCETVANLFSAMRVSFDAKYYRDTGHSLSKENKAFLKEAEKVALFFGDTVELLVRVESCYRSGALAHQCELVPQYKKFYEAKSQGDRRKVMKAIDKAAKRLHKKAAKVREERAKRAAAAQ
ncbi:MAG: hypothetical protein MHM6MM_002639 [Cercozoa sp. M6MM]